MVPWAHLSQQPKWHIDRFSRFAGLTIVTDRQTARYSVCNNRPHVRSIAMRPNNNKNRKILLGIYSPVAEELRRRELLWMRAHHAAAINYTDVVAACRRVCRAAVAHCSPFIKRRRKSITRAV